MLLNKIGSISETQGTEPSKYLEEKKSKRDSLSSGERKGKSLNPLYVEGLHRCRVGVAGLHLAGCKAGRRVKKL